MFNFRLTPLVLALGISLMMGAQSMAQDQHIIHPDRSHPPAIGQPKAVTIPPIVKRTLSNGIPVWFIERQSTPLATVALFVRAGASDEPAAKMGLAALTAECLDEGTEKYDALKFAEETENLGAYLSIDPAYFGSTISLTVPNKRLAAGLDLMAQAVLHPTFPQEEIQRIKGRALTSFVQQRQDPSTLASCAFMKTIYASQPENRQGYSVNGQADTFATLTREDIQDFYQRHYQPQQATIAVTGRVNVDEVCKLLEKEFGQWQASPKSEAQVAQDFKDGLSQPAAQPQAEGKVLSEKGFEHTIYVVDRPGSPQSVLRVGRVGFARSTPHFFPLRVMNTALGGSFMSRLNQNLREEHGYTYGARSMLVFRVEPGPFCVATDVQADKTVAALREILKEIEEMRQPLPQDELERTRNYICYGYPQSFETSLNLAQRILEMQLYNLPDDYYDTYVANVESVDQKAMGPLRLTFFDPRAMKIVVVGDAQAIAKQLEGLRGWKMEILPVDSFMGREVKP